MYVETIDGDDEEYIRLETEDWEEIKGKRIIGEGKVESLTNAEGEHHPAVIRTDEGSLFTPSELDYVEWDGRHDFVHWNTDGVEENSPSSGGPETETDTDGGEGANMDADADPEREVMTDGGQDPVEDAPEWTPDDTGSTRDLTRHDISGADVETLGDGDDALFIQYRGWEWSFERRSEHARVPEERGVDHGSVTWDMAGECVELGAEAAFIHGEAADGTHMERTYKLQDVHPADPEVREKWRQDSEDGEDVETDGGQRLMTDGGREPMNVSADAWEDMTLRFDDPRESPRVANEPVDFSSLSPGDVVVLDVGKHTGPAEWSYQRTVHFNKSAYRVTERSGGGNTVSMSSKQLDPSDGRADKLRWNLSSSAGPGKTALWAEQRVSADAKAYRVLEPLQDG